MPVPVVNGNELLLHGIVGLDPFEGGFTAAELILALSDIGPSAPVTVRINSPGGAATEGVACYSALRAHRGKVTVQIEAIAASAGSLVAMAGDVVRIVPGSFLMIHDVHTITVGNAAAHTKSIEQIDRLSETYAAAYAERTGKSAAAMREAMRAETWYSADEAIAAGLADELATATDNPEPAAFAYRAYARAPERIVALADARGWNRSLARAGAPAPHQEPMMTTTPSAGAPPADQKARIKAILECEAAKGREALAQHFAFETDDPAEKAVAALAKAPKGDAAAATPEAYAAMRSAAGGLAMPGGQPQASAPRPAIRWGDVATERGR